MIELSFNGGHMDAFKEEVGKEFEGKEKDLKIIDKRLKYWTEKYENENDLRSINKEKGMKVGELIPKLERTLGHSIDRNLKMFTIKGYYNNAIEISKDNG